MIMGDLLVIYNEVAVRFTANAIRLSALESLGLCIGSPMSVRYLRVAEAGKEKTVL